LVPSVRHCEARSAEAIQLGGSEAVALLEFSLDCFASLAMTIEYDMP
jgi:hypothetical protein